MKSTWVVYALAFAVVDLAGLNLHMGIASASPLFHELQQMRGYGHFYCIVASHHSGGLLRVGWWRNQLGDSQD